MSFSSFRRKATYYESRARLTKTLTKIEQA